MTNRSTLVTTSENKGTRESYAPLESSRHVRLAREYRRAWCRRALLSGPEGKKTVSVHLQEEQRKEAQKIEKGVDESANVLVKKFRGTPRK